jgi:MFS transporter, MHS family, shikimate and dehydroshikimate transport protein
MNPRPMMQTVDQTASIRAVVAASAIGTTIEWYDFLIYATAASLVLNKLFFPTKDPLVGTLISISTHRRRLLGSTDRGHYLEPLR